MIEHQNIVSMLDAKIFINPRPTMSFVEATEVHFLLTLITGPGVFFDPGGT